MLDNNKNKDQIWFENFMQGMAELKERQEASAIEAEEQRKKDAVEREEQRKKDAAEAKKRDEEFDKRLTESSAEWEKRMKESAAEWEKRMTESAADLKKWQKEMQKNIGGIGESNGAVAEAMIFNTLERDMTFAGINFDDIHSNMGYHSKRLGIKDEYDIVLRNGDTLAIIETKYKVRDKDVTKLLGTKLSNFRLLYPEYDSYKIMLCVGGMSFEKDAIEEAQNNGVGIIKIVGNKVECYTDAIKMY